MSADGADRYVVQPTGAGWRVWDTLRDAPVFRAERMTQDQARTLARRLNDAYRQATPRCGGVPG